MFPQVYVEISLVCTHRTEFAVWEVFICMYLDIPKLCSNVFVSTFTDPSGIGHLHCHLILSGFMNVPLWCLWNDVILPLPFLWSLAKLNMFSCIRLSDFLFYQLLIHYDFCCILLVKEIHKTSLRSRGGENRVHL